MNHSKRRAQDTDTALAEMIDEVEVDEAARRRAAGLHDAEQKKRRQAALELLEELQRPLIARHGASDLDEIAARMPNSRRRR